MNVNLQVGPQILQDGSLPISRAGRGGENIIQQLHGRYYEQTFRKNIFSASNQSAQAVSVALATAYTGLCLSNPLGSGVNLSLLKVSYALTIAPVATASIHLIGGYSASTNVVQTAVVTPQPNFLGAVASNAKVASQATIPAAPAYLFSLFSGFTAGALPSSALAAIDFEGSFIIPPGGYIAIGALTSVTGFGSVMWEEVQT